MTAMRKGNSRERLTRFGPGFATFLPLGLGDGSVGESANSCKSLRESGLGWWAIQDLNL